MNEYQSEDSYPYSEEYQRSLRFCCKCQKKPSIGSPVYTVFTCRKENKIVCDECKEGNTMTSNDVRRSHE